MIAGVYREDMAVATGSASEMQKRKQWWSNFVLVTYLFRTTGQVLGVSLSGAILQAVLLRRLRLRINGPDADQVGVLLEWDFFLFMTYNLI